jgi:zona occludens toxin (predicted ATPase)
MAIVVLVLWMVTAGAGFYLLVTSNLGRARPADATTAAKQAPASERATASVTAAAQTAATPASTTPPISKREIRRAARDRFDPPSLTAAKNAPVVPGLRPLLEFAHPACAIVGLGFWLGYTFVHYRALGWIAFALVTVTACLGLSWFAANTRTARRQDATSRDDAAGGRPEDEDEARPSFSSRLVALHGGAAAVTFALAALTILVLRR